MEVQNYAAQECKHAEIKWAGWVELVPAEVIEKYEDNNNLQHWHSQRLHKNTAPMQSSQVLFHFEMCDQVFVGGVIFI